MAARIVPQDAGPQHLVGGIDQRRAMHLAGQADALDSRKLFRMRCFEFANGFLGRPDPIGRILLGPTGMRARNVKLAMAGGDRLLVGVDQQRFDAGCAEIDSEIHIIPPARCSSRPFVLRHREGANSTNLSDGRLVGADTGKLTKKKAVCVSGRSVVVRL